MFQVAFRIGLPSMKVLSGTFGIEGGMRFAELARLNVYVDEQDDVHSCQRKHINKQEN
jgi:hypothetical protein